MLSLSFECGTSTAGCSARPALRMRVNMSEMGSVIILPACFGHTRNQTVQRGFAERQTRHTELADVSVTATADGAAVHQPGWAGVTRQLGEARVITLGLQFSTHRGILLHRRRLALVALKPCFLRHKIYFSAKG